MDTSYLTTQVSTIIGQLHGLFDDIGVPSHERDSRESEVSPSISIQSYGPSLKPSIALHRSVRDIT